jgi:hypothetical protein
MGLKETTRAIRRFVGDRKSFIEIVAGPSLAEVIHIEDSTVAYPLGSLGNDAAINFGVRLLNGLGVPTDQGFVSEAQRQGEPFYGLTAIVYAGLSDAELDLAVKASSRHTDRVRAVLSFYTAGNHTILIRFKWAEATRGGVEFVAPPYRRGVQSRHDGPPF